MSNPGPTLDLLAWVAERSRTYEETIEVWKTSCPRLSTWDDAVGDGLVRIVRSPGRDALVTLTPAGSVLIAEASAPAR